MKRILTIGVLLLCLTTTQTAHAAEDRNAKIKAEMVQNYLLWEIAWKNKDADRMISFESPDYTSVTQDKRVIPKRESDEMWRTVMKSVVKVYRVRAEIKKLTIEKNRVVVLTNQHVDALRQWGDERPRRVDISGQVREIWVNYDGAWMLKCSEDLS